MQAANTERELIIGTVRKFVQNEVIPVASEMEHRNEYPHALVEQMKEMGLFGVNIPEQYGGSNADTTTFAMIFEEISRGWLGLAGVLGSNSVMCDVLVHFGTEEQKQRFLPSMATGEMRGGICLTESNAGTDLQNISTTAIRDGDVYRVNGSKMWITNARHGNTFLLLAKSDPKAQPAHRGMSAFIFEKGAPGMVVGRDIDKLGYKGVETCELHFDNFAIPAENLIGGVEGQGFKQVMTGLEAERLNVAARGLGIARAAFEEAIKYAQRRVTFGKAIAEYQTIQNKLADMATTHRSLAPVDLLRRRKTRPWRALRSGSRHGQTLRHGDRRGSCLRSHAYFGRQRLLQRFSRRTLLPRRAAGRDRRRHQRIAAPDHRAQSPQEIQGQRLV